MSSSCSNVTDLMHALETESLCIGLITAIPTLVSFFLLSNNNPTIVAVSQSESSSIRPLKEEWRCSFMKSCPTFICGWPKRLRGNSFRKIFVFWHFNTSSRLLFFPVPDFIIILSSVLNSIQTDFLSFNRKSCVRYGQRSPVQVVHRPEVRCWLFCILSSMI